MSYASPQPRRINPSVCPLPRSLATTCGISVDVFSSPYLDVSVQAVPHNLLFYSQEVDRVLLCRVSPFGYPRIEGCFRLPVAFRRSLRPSSASNAKAFPLRPYQLDLFQNYVSYRFLLISSTFYCSKNFYPKQLFRLFEYFWLHYLVVSISHYLYSVFKVHFYHKAFLLYVVGPSGLEPPTSRLSGVRSNHLSYEPISMWFCRLLSFRTLFYSGPQSLVEISGIEPLTPCLQSRCSPS